MTECAIEYETVIVDAKPREIVDAWRDLFPRRSMPTIFPSAQAGRTEVTPSDRRTAAALYLYLLSRGHKPL